MPQLLLGPTRLHSKVCLHQELSAKELSIGSAGGTARRCTGEPATLASWSLACHAALRQRSGLNHAYVGPKARALMDRPAQI
jgi:hypothetical protein